MQMIRDRRPLSPELQIYRPQLTSVLSITHRITGVALALGSLLLVGWLASAAAGPSSYTNLHAALGFTWGRMLLLGWTFCLFFHLCNGIRHLFWDAGYGFELKAIYASGWTVVGTSLGLTLATWILSYRM
jgi:succinate dehydrogenase / fumarate reductase, cytochrome b subunit